MRKFAERLKELRTEKDLSDKRASKNWFLFYLALGKWSKRYKERSIDNSCKIFRRKHRLFIRIDRFTLTLTIKSKTFKIPQHGGRRTTRVFLKV